MSGIDIRSVAEARSMIKEEVDRLEEKRARIARPEVGEWRFVLAMVVLLTASTIILLAWPEALVLWVLGIFILYSFNYIVFFLPITRHHSGRKRKRSILDRPVRGPLRHLLARPKFLVEVGATMFLAGMVPLARSFLLLFGSGMTLILYHGTYNGDLPLQLTLYLVLQILVILVYFLLVVFLSPQSQGFTRIARSLKYKVLSARSEGRRAYILAMALSGALIVAISLVAVGAVLLPGRTMDSLIGFLGGNVLVLIPALAAVLAMEFFIMRVPQSVGSRKMAVDLLDDKVQALRCWCLEPLDEIITEAAMHNRSAVERARLEEVLCIYYPIVMYKVIETNIFGRLPVFLVAPDVDLLFDLEALRYVGVPRDRDGRPMIDGRTDG